MQKFAAVAVAVSLSSCFQTQTVPHKQMGSVQQQLPSTVVAMEGPSFPYTRPQSIFTGKRFYTLTVKVDGTGQEFKCRQLIKKGNTIISEGTHGMLHYGSFATFDPDPEGDVL